jgi:4-amino-4-deoxy-L-arabinose transferase-like glycosyltransferase
VTTNDATWRPGQPLPPLRPQAEPEVAAASSDDAAVASDAAWARPALLALLAGTALLYLWGLGASGWANDFYSAAAQAGSQSWKAFFFGSSDAANSITVDKPPMSLWAMALSVRVFGLSSWSILVPQALMGVASVGLLYATVRRWFSPAAALLSGAVLALTPVAVLMFRFNDPDALLVLLLTASAYATVRALERAQTKWIVLAGALVGFAFLTKMLQALLVVPAIAVAYGVAAPTPLRRRLLQILAGGAAMVGAAAWWVAIVEFVPASMRPYIGGSQHNSVLELIFGYNGFGRLTGNETGSVGGGGPAGAGGGAMWGPTSWHRMFDAEWGGQIAWLLPAALALLAAGLWITRRAPRTDRTRAALVLWGGWLVVTALVFSFGQGIIHPYYAVALAPAIGALVGIGAVMLWQRRGDVRARAVLAAVVVGTAVLAWSLLGRSSSWHPELRALVIVAGLAAAGLLLAGDRFGPRVRMATVAAALIATMSAPLAYSLQTAATPHDGAIPSAGPAVAGGFGPGARGGLRGGMPGGMPGFGPGQGGAMPAFPGAAQGGAMPAFPGAAGGGALGGTGRPGGAGGLLRGSRPSDAIVALLKQNAAGHTWVAATVGSNSAAGYQLATGEPVMPLGGFNGSDPSPTLQGFKALVAAGKIHWFIGGGGFGAPMGGSRTSSEIASWVADTFPSQTVGGVTVYDLTASS